MRREVNGPGPHAVRGRSAGLVDDTNPAQSRSADERPTARAQLCGCRRHHVCVDTDPGAGGSGGDASLLRARLSAILDITLDPLILVRPVCDATGQVVDFVIADMNESHSRAGGDRLTTARMRLAERSPELFSMYCRVLASGATESVRRVWIGAHPDDATSSSGWADVRATPVAGDLVVSWRGVDADVAAENLLRAQAMQDPLTHLPNRRGLMEMLAGACAAPDRRRRHSFRGRPVDVRRQTSGRRPASFRRAVADD